MDSGYFFYSPIFFSLLSDLPPNSRGTAADHPRNTGYELLVYNDKSNQRWATDQTNILMENFILNTLLFADDEVIVASTENELQEQYVH